MKLNRFIKQFNWRFLLVRILVNAIALAITVALVPKIDFVDASILNWLLMAIMLGVLNALVKPLLQFLTLQFIFVTFGLVLVIVNALILMLLSLLFPNQFSVGSILWALLGGLVLGGVSSFLESLLGLSMPIIPEEETALRRQLEEEARGISWHVASRRAAALEQQVMEMEATEQEASAAASAAAAAPAEPDEGAPPPNDEAEPSAPVATPPAEAATVADPSPADGQEEDRS